MEKFIADYRIPNTVGLRYCKEGEWHIMRQKGEVVIPIKIGRASCRERVCSTV